MKIYKRKQKFYVHNIITVPKRKLNNEKITSIGENLMQTKKKKTIIIFLQNVRNNLLRLLN